MCTDYKKRAFYMILQLDLFLVKIQYFELLNIEIGLENKNNGKYAQLGQFDMESSIWINV